MIEDVNPYKPPAAWPIVQHRLHKRPSLDYLAFAAWPIVLASNSIFFCYAGARLFQSNSRSGAMLAVFILLFAGWLLGWLRPVAARKLILGATVLVFTQFFPVLQSVLGYIALVGAGNLKLAAPIPGGVTTALGGFLITFTIGAALIGCAALVGSLIGLFLPEKWLRYRCPSPKCVGVADAVDFYA